MKRTVFARLQGQFFLCVGGAELVIERYQILVCVIVVSYLLPVRKLAEGAPRGNSDLHCRRAACWHGIFHADRSQRSGELTPKYD